LLSDQSCGTVGYCKVTETEKWEGVDIIGMREHLAYSWWWPSWKLMFSWLCYKWISVTF